MKRTIQMLPILLLAILPALPGAAQQAEDEDRYYARNFTLNNVDARVAEAWFWELCEELSGGPSCLVEEAEPGDNPRLAVRGPSRVHSAFARRLAERDLGTATHEFQLLLVGASKQGSAMDKELPASAKKALEDVREFLPFTSFQLIDTGWMKTSSHGSVELGGGAGPRYLAQLRFQQRITLDGVVLDIRELEVVAHLPTGTRERLIGSSLTLEIGETAVLGTSKLNGGDKAIIVLLTAIR